MDILVITWNFPPRRGGMEQLLASLCDGFRKNHRPLIITSHAGHTYRDEENVYRPSYPGLVAFFLYAFGKGVLLLRQHSDLKIVFGGSALVVPVVLLLARGFRRKAVVQAHGLDVVHSNALYQLFCVRWLKFCNTVIANSAYTASLIEQKGAQPDRILVIPPGVHLESFAAQVNVQAIKNEFDLQGKRIILFVGRLVRRKGVKEFIQNSLAKILQEVPDVCFVIVGGNPKESLTHQHNVLGEIEAVVSEMKLQNHVKLLGALADDYVIKLYQACDVVVLPALALADDVEGFGIVLLEAAAAGKPVVSTRIGGIADAVEDGASGILVAPEQYESMSHSIIRLLADHEISSAIGEYAKRRVKERFSWDSIVARYEKAFV